MSTPHATLQATLTAEQIAYLVQRGEPQRVSCAGIEVEIQDDGTLLLTIPDDLLTAISTSAPGWVDGWRRADAG